MLYAPAMSTLIDFPHRGSPSASLQVADEVRGYLAKRKIATYKIPKLLESKESRGYWQRRISGELPLNMDDLERLAALLGVQIIDFIPRGKPHGGGNSQEELRFGNARMQGNVTPLRLVA